ncbi:unnamed protein product, partial [Staurois parvus]
MPYTVPAHTTFPVHRLYTPCPIQCLHTHHIPHTSPLHTMPHTVPAHTTFPIHRLYTPCPIQCLHTHHIPRTSPLHTMPHTVSAHTSHSPYIASTHHAPY